MNIALPSAVDCGSLPDPENGRVKAVSGTTYNNTVQYSCNAGYMLIGEEMRTCQSNLSWIPPAPYCVGKLVYLHAIHTFPCTCMYMTACIFCISLKQPSVQVKFLL